MPVFSVDDLDIHFPFDPYDVQKDLMTKVVECINIVSPPPLIYPRNSSLFYLKITLLFHVSRKEMDCWNRQQVKLHFISFISKLLNKTQWKQLFYYCRNRKDIIFTLCSCGLAEEAKGNCKKGHPSWSNGKCLRSASRTSVRGSPSRRSHVWY